MVEELVKSDIGVGTDILVNFAAVWLQDVQPLEVSGEDMSALNLNTLMQEYACLSYA